MALVLYTPEAAAAATGNPVPAPTETLKYKGLSNQGVTCYMNSLLQTLFMTPEFRMIVYDWQYDEVKHGKTEYSIPYQLQRLFAKLQIGLRPFVETRMLTKSFNWDVYQLSEQQDIQELVMQLFQAIEQSDPDKRLNVRQLYEGTLSDYVKCTVCGHVSERKDCFINLSVPINDPFTKTCNSSLEMALENYLKPETLSGTNMYKCEKCTKPVEASKGLKFLRLPMILAFQLNRFTINMATFTRAKINDRVTFPFILNMNNYINGYEGIKKKATEYQKELESELKLFGIEPQKPPLGFEKFADKMADSPGKPKPQEETKHKSDEPHFTAPLGVEEDIGGVSGVDLTDKERQNPYLWETKPRKRNIMGEEEPAPKIVREYGDPKPDPYEYSVQCMSPQE